MANEPDDDEEEFDPKSPFDSTADLRVMEKEPAHTAVDIAALTKLNEAAEAYFQGGQIDVTKLEALAEAKKWCRMLGIWYDTIARVVRRAALRVGQGVNDEH